jgi:integrase
LARDLEFKTGMLQVWDSKTEAGVRGIPMTTRVRAILERRAETYKTAPLFPYSWEVFFNAWLRLKAALKLEEDAEFVPYCLRHTFATRLVQRGVRIEVIKGLMGHESIQQTMQYAHVGAHQYAEAIKALENPGQVVTQPKVLSPAVTGHAS